MVKEVREKITKYKMKLQINQIHAENSGGMANAVKIRSHTDGITKGVIIFSLTCVLDQKFNKAKSG